MQATGDLIGYITSLSSVQPVDILFSKLYCKIVFSMSPIGFICLNLHIHLFCVVSIAVIDVICLVHTLLLHFFYT